MDIRKATKADHEAIWQILRPIFREGETYAIDRDISREDALRYWLSDDHTTLVAVEDEQIFGTCYFRQLRDGGGGHVCGSAYATSENARGRGVARMLLAHTLDATRDLGFTAMHFQFVVATNERAIETWQRSGFEIVGRLPGAFLHPREGYVDALQMFKLL